MADNTSQMRIAPWFVTSVWIKLPQKNNWLIWAVVHPMIVTGYVLPVMECAINKGVSSLRGCCGNEESALSVNCCISKWFPTYTSARSIYRNGRWLTGVFQGPYKVVMATTSLNKKLKSKKHNLKEDKCQSTTRRPSERFRKRKRITLREADVIDLWVTDGRSKGFSTDVDIARFLLSLWVFMEYFVLLGFIHI